LRKELLFAGILSATTSLAHAQSSVTLYGLIDTGITFVSNQGGSHNVQTSAGSLNGNRWGLKGAEDLGGGLSALFTIESGYGILDGKLKQGGRQFGRQAFVGLASTQYGTVTVGRQTSNIVDYLGPMSLPAGSWSNHPYDNDNLNNSFRVNNSVKYQSPTYGGLRFGGIYGFSNQAGGFSANRTWNLGVDYAYGSLRFATSYLFVNHGGTSVNPSGAVSDDAPFTAERQRTYGAGLNYAFGKTTVGLVFTQTRLDNPVSISGSASGRSGNLALAGSSARFTNYEVNVRYNITPAWMLLSSYTFTDANFNGVSPKFNQVNVELDHLLSKRTDVYLQTIYQHVSGTGRSGITADIDGLTASSTNNQTAVTVGLRHRF